jgi:energy-coupling factor transporter ATP-binding protein EcfA2
MPKSDVLARAAEFPREEFIEEYWDYAPGEHVTFLGPTGSGKTTLAYELLGNTASKELPVVVLVMKPRDATVDKWTRQYKWKVLRKWPPGPLTGKYAGYVLQPKHSYEPQETNAHLFTQFRRAILDTYNDKRNWIVFIDETYGLSDELHMDEEMVTVWSRGRSMGTGIWAATQKPTHIPLWAYSQAEHLFLAHDPDARARKRFGEIGGIDGRYVEEQVQRLDKYQWLYIRRTGPEAAVILP